VPQHRQHHRQRAAVQGRLGRLDQAGLQEGGGRRRPHVRRAGAGRERPGETPGAPPCPLAHARWCRGSSRFVSTGMRPGPKAGRQAALQCHASRGRPRLQGDAGKWKGMSNTYGAVWEVSGFGSPPLDILLRDQAGQQVVLRWGEVGSLSPSATCLAQGGRVHLPAAQRRAAAPAPTAAGAPSPRPTQVGTS
jgi:hypothetical protein